MRHRPVKFGTELVRGSRIERDLVPALHEMRWSCLTDRIGREVRLGTLPQPIPLSLAAPSIGVTLRLLQRGAGGPADALNGDLSGMDWGQTVTQTCRLPRYSGGRRRTRDAQGSKLDTLAARRPNALKNTPLLKSTYGTSVPAFSFSANYRDANIVNRSTPCCTAATIKSEGAINQC